MAPAPPLDARDLYVLDEVANQLGRWREFLQCGLHQEAGLELAGIEATAMLFAHNKLLLFRMYELVADQQFTGLADADLVDQAIKRLRPLLVR